jgi:type IV pilus assembly protein PilY1
MNTHSAGPLRTYLRGFAGVALVVAGIAGYSASAFAQPADGTVDLLSTPPEITSSVSPNIVVTFDDSGSMGFHFMPDEIPYYNRRWHNTTGGVTGLGIRDDQSVFANNRYNYATIPFLCAAVIDPAVTDRSNPRSFSINGVYYNPNLVYKVPLKDDGITPFPTPRFTSAWNNGIRRNRPDSPVAAQDNIVSTADSNRNVDGSRDLSTANFCGQTGAGYFKLKSNVALTVDAQNRISNPADLYLASNWEWVPLPADQQTNFAIWWSYYHTRYLTLVSSLSRAFGPFDETVRIAFQNMNNNQIVASTTINKFVGTVRENFYTQLFASPVGGGTPTLTSTVRVGEFFRRSTGSALTNPYWEEDLGIELSCRQNFHFLTTDGFWNQTPPGASTVLPNDHTTQTLPDGKAFNVGDAESKIMWNENYTASVTLADIAWKYWATDLRNLANRVPPFLPDRATDLFAPITPSLNPLDDKEIYWNPANNPATWQHMVNFMISFGVDGRIPKTDANYRDLRLGNLQWPRTAANTTPNVDDMWHAAINSRGQAFTASNPDELIAAMSEVVSSILARRGASTAVSVSLPIITDGTTGYSAGYDSADWSGFVTRNRLDPNTAQPLEVLWDAGCKLNGGNCTSTGQSGLPVRDPNTRQIFTSSGVPGTGTPFRWADLTARHQSRLSTSPTTLRLDTDPPTVATDSYGENRVEYVRGNRTNETTLNPRMRARGSVMGAVIRGQPVYVSSPTSGHRDTFPVGSPEQVAAAANAGYAEFQNTWIARSPTLYVAANDGMLHAFDARNGTERFAYVPNTVIDNYRLTKSTQAESGLTPTVDDKPLVYDAFVNGRWRTLLVGSLRLGGRGIYALDVTNPVAINEAAASTAALWEFSNAAPTSGGGTDCQPGARFCSSLGYTYESVNLARIRYQNKWVALVSSGYFPIDPLDPASREAAASRTSLLVIDLNTGTLIKELRTSTAPQVPGATRSFGLSQPIVYDFGLDQINDIALAGDLAGNLWRFDISSADPNDWKVDLIFRTYGNGGAPAAGDQPIASAPIPMADPVTGGAIHVFGSGKFIGAPDRSPAIPTQNFYGIRDYGTCSATNTDACSKYPITVDQLVSQTLTQDANFVRRITSTNAVPDTKRGWRIPLAIPGEPGERSGGPGFPFYSSNQILLRSIIPKGTDPCDPGASYGLMVVNAANGQATVDPNDSSPSRIVGGIVRSSTPPGDPVTVRGGGQVLIPGVPPCPPNTICDPANPGANANQAIAAAASNADSIWARASWRELLDRM